jgi:hypothetical protein
VSYQQVISTKSPQGSAVLARVLTMFVLLSAVLDPALMAYDAYGLHHAADKPDREGHAISMMGAKDAQVMGEVDNSTA